MHITRSGRDYNKCPICGAIGAHGCLGRRPILPKKPDVVDCLGRVAVKTVSALQEVLEENRQLRKELEKALTTTRPDGGDSLREALEIANDLPRNYRTPAQQALIDEALNG